MLLRFRELSERRQEARRCLTLPKRPLTKGQSKELFSLESAKIKPLLGAMALSRLVKSSELIYEEKIFDAQVFYYSTNLFSNESGLPKDISQGATIGIGIIMVVMTLVSIPLMDRTGRRTLHLYGLGGMFIFSIFITISLLIKVSKHIPIWSFQRLFDDRTLRYFFFLFSIPVLLKAFVAQRSSNMAERDATAKFFFPSFLLYSDSFGRLI